VRVAYDTFFPIVRSADLVWVFLLPFAARVVPFSK